MRTEIALRACVAASVLVLGSSPLWLASPVRAEPTASERAIATQLYDDASKLMDGNHYGEACAKFAESQRLDPQLGTLLHMADCYEKAGRTASAWASFRDAAEVAGRKNDPRATIATSRATALEQKLPHVILQVDSTGIAAGFEVQKDGQIVGSGTWGSAIPLDPGRHEFSATAPGYKKWSSTVQIDATGGTTRVSIPRLVPETSAAEPAVVSPVSATPPGSSPGSPPGDAPANLASADAPRAGSGAPADVGTSTGGGTQRTIGYVLGGAGILGLGAGVVFGLVRNAKINERDGLCSGDICRSTAEKSQFDDLTSNARSAATLSTVGFAAGGLAVAAGVILVLSAPRTQSAVSVQPWMTATSVGGGLTGSF